MRSASMTVLVLAAAVGAAAAGVPPEPWVEVVRHADQPVSLFCTPAGDGAPFAEALGFGGFRVDATLEIILFNDAPGWGYPVANYPAEDIWLDSFDPTLAACRGGTIPDADTDQDGRTFWARPLRTGGIVDPDAGSPLLLMVNGTPASGLPELGLHLNSADLNGDGFVNLTDAGRFATDLFGLYAYRSDFVWDGVINISDAGRMAGALGGACP
jgi:hypothetical protein